MFCHKCGARNSDEAVYCQKCGTALEAEEETRIARSVKDVRPVDIHPVKQTIEPDATLDEKQVFSIRPTLMFVKIGYAAAVIGAFLLVSLLVILAGAIGITIPPLVLILLGFSLLLIPAFYHFKRNVIRYTLTDSKIEIDEGFISQKTRNIPLRTIQDVMVSASIPQRMLGFGNLIIENANETDGKVVLKNINSPKRYADILLKQMRQLDK